MDFLHTLLDPIIAAVPNILGTILLILIAWIIAVIVRKLIVKGLRAIHADRTFQKWGVAKNESDAKGVIKTVASVGYYLVFVFFLPAILNGLNIGGVLEPITNMFDKFFAFIPNIIGSGLILVLAFYLCGFVRDLVQGLLEKVDIDGWMNKLVNKSEGAVGETVQDQVDAAPSGNKLAKVGATIVYVLLFIPLLTAALEVLGIESISRPIINVLNMMLAAIPNILVAAILIAMGGLVSKLVGDLIENLLEAANINKYTKYLNTSGDVNVKLSAIVANIVKAVIVIFFFVEALNVLQLEVLNTIGAAIIAYLPLVLSAVIILILGVVGGNLLSQFLKESTGSNILANIVQYGLIALAIFMALDQLQFAQTIVNTGFMFIVGGAAVAFALAFGLGGRDFAKKQLEHLDRKLHEGEEDKKDQDGDHSQF
ncbi:mechanosensitive ion channel [Aerococcus sp. Group 2]|uniref:mechanosensitive ion channel n=1 Tax=Aerococcus sp. Group 2 TaxID=2976811 RepID=UPI0018A70EFD|nr:mechanosensitive ion channel [Aerococcus sp. Group 2]